MKKIVFLLILLLVCIFVCACFYDRDITNDNTDALTELSDSETESESAMSEIPVELFSVEIKQESLQTDSYIANMKYPQISGYSDKETEEKVNALIYSYVNNKRKTFISQTGADSVVYYDIDSFNVTYKSDKLISALCRGTITVEGSSIETAFSYGINIDFISAKLIGLDSIVDYKNFEKDFTNGSFVQTSGYKNLLEETNFKDIISQYNALYSIYPEFYIKQSENGVALGVITDTVQVLGNVAEFEGDVTDKGYMTKYFKDLIS